MKWRGKLNLKTEEESWLTVLCCRRPNIVSCKIHSNTPGISIHAFPKEAKRKQKWTTFARIHRLACQRNTLPCVRSLLKHRVSAEVGQQWISRGFTLGKVQYHQYTRSRKIHWTLITQEMREDLQIDFSRETFFGTLLPYRETSVSKIPHHPPPQEIDFFSDWVGLFEVCFRSSEMTGPQPCLRGWAYFSILSRSTKTCQAQTNNNYQLQKSIFFMVQRNITGQNALPKRLKDVSWEKHARRMVQNNTSHD